VRFLQDIFLTTVFCWNLPVAISLREGALKPIDEIADGGA
jgi:hypothetical protein